MAGSIPRKLKNAWGSSIRSWFIKRWKCPCNCLLSANSQGRVWYFLGFLCFFTFLLAFLGFTAFSRSFSINSSKRQKAAELLLCHANPFRIEWNHNKPVQHLTENIYIYNVIVAGSVYSLPFEVNSYYNRSGFVLHSKWIRTAFKIATPNEPESTRICIPTNSVLIVLIRAQCDWGIKLQRGPWTVAIFPIFRCRGVRSRIQAHSTIDRHKDFWLERCRAPCPQRFPVLSFLLRCVMPRNSMIILLTF